MPDRGRFSENHQPVLVHLVREARWAVVGLPDQPGGLGGPDWWRIDAGSGPHLGVGATHRGKRILVIIDLTTVTAIHLDTGGQPQCESASPGTWTESGQTSILRPVSK